MSETHVATVAETAASLVATSAPTIEQRLTALEDRVSKLEKPAAKPQGKHDGSWSSNMPKASVP